MKEKQIKAVCFGEVLWDIFPDKARIGGAPLNVASRLSTSGVQTEIISKVGKDEKGEQLLAYLQENKVGTKNIKSDAAHPTGMVNVSLNSSRSATYEIAYSAWDKIELTGEMINTVEQADVFIYGSLASRDEVSRNTLFQLLQNAKFKIFDINLRPPHYKKNVLNDLLKNADFIKFNDDELYEISAMLESPYNSLEQNLHFIAKNTPAKMICVTKGSHGAVLLKDEKLYYNSGYKIKVKDTVGAGDSFLAALIAKLLKKEDPQTALNYACAVGALVAGHEGANPVLTEEEIREFMFPV